MDEASTFDIDDYIALTSEDRSRFDLWLRSIGAAPTRTRKVTLYQWVDYVVVEEYVVDGAGHLSWDKKAKDVCITQKGIHTSSSPPVWKSI